MILYIIYFYMIAYGKANATLDNANCTNCYRENAEEHFSRVVSRHWYEVTISDNSSAKSNLDVLFLNNKCKGAIITPNMAITLASFFVNHIKFKEFVVYYGYLILEENENLGVCKIDNIFKHPKFIKSNINDIAVVKVKGNFAFNISGSPIALLPDTFMDFANSKDSICTVLYQQTDVFGADILRSLKVDLLTKEECADLIRVDNLTLSLNMKSFCIKPSTSYNKPANITEGATCVCNGVIKGIITEKYSGVNINQPLPVVDLGLYTNWIRKKIINLNHVSQARIDRGDTFTGIVLILLFWNFVWVI